MPQPTIGQENPFLLLLSNLSCLLSKHVPLLCFGGSFGLLMSPNGLLLFVYFSLIVWDIIPDLFHQIDTRFLLCPESIQVLQLET
jgi:hypothetical protein